MAIDKKEMAEAKIKNAINNLVPKGRYIDLAILRKYVKDSRDEFDSSILIDLLIHNRY